MKPIYNIILIITAFTIQVQAQEELKSEEGNASFLSSAHKNQLDVDMKNLFTGLGNTAMLYKRTLGINEKGGNSGTLHLLRFRGYFNGDSYFTNEDYDDFEVDFFPKTQLRYAVGIGYEVQQVRNRFVHYYGVEGVFSYNNVIRRVTSIGGSYEEVTKLRAAPFFGVKYFFTDRISVGVETSVAVAYFQSTAHSFVYATNDLGYETQDSNTATGVDFSFSNLRFLTLGCVF